MNRLLASLLFACVLAGCEPAEDPARTTDLARTPRALACTELATAMCERYAACAETAARVGPGVGATCVATLRDHCLRTAGLGGSARTVDVVNACAAATKSLSCPVFLTRYPDVCDPLPGTRENGAACTFDEQCATRFCAREVDTACGTCVPPRALGASCLGGACGGALLCTSANQCSKPGAVGEPCGPNAPCERSLFCDVNRCAARRSVGEACAGVGQCDAYVVATCNESFHCRAATVAKLGEPCTFTANALTLCEAPARCIDDRCAAPKRAGETCTTAYECDGFGAECLRGRCVLRVIETCDQK